MRVGEKFEIVDRRLYVVWGVLLQDWRVDGCTNRGAGLGLVGSRWGLGTQQCGKKCAKIISQYYILRGRV